jgi:hypothetical protein
VLAWVYVLLRYAHSWVHCGPNKVMLRFRFFAMSFFALVSIWVTWGYALLGK